MTINWKILADGQLGTSAASIYSPSAGQSAAVHKVTFFNTSTSTTETVHVHITPSGGTRREIHQIVLEPEWGAIVLDLLLEAGDSVDANTTNATTVNYEIMGALET